MNTQTFISMKCCRVEACKSVMVQPRKGVDYFGNIVILKYNFFEEKKGVGNGNVFTFYFCLQNLQ